MSSFVDISWRFFSALQIVLSIAYFKLVDNPKPIKVKYRIDQSIILKLHACMHYFYLKIIFLSIMYITSN